MKRIFLMVMMVFLMGCGSDQEWFDFTGSSIKIRTNAKPATIDTSTFQNGRLLITGSCGKDGDVLLVLPATAGDKRIIDAPKCSHGRYEVLTSKFGRPPCAVIVEYGGRRQVEAKVSGTEFYCD